MIRRHGRGRTVDQTQALVRPPYRLVEEQGEHHAVHGPSVAV